MKVLITSPYHKEHLVDEFSKYCDVSKTLTSDTTLIIPTVDEELPFFAIAREWFLTQGVRVMVAGVDTITTCRDKAEFYRVCKRHGFAVIPTMQDDFIAKPRFGKGSKGHTRIDRSYIVQPVMSYPEYSVDYFADWDGTPISIIPRLRLNIKDGESQTAEIRMTPRIIDVCKRLGPELGLVGYNVIQGFDSGTEFILSEINPRFGGGSWLTWHIFNPVKWLVTNGVSCISKRNTFTI